MTARTKYGFTVATLSALGLVLGAMTLVALVAAEHIERRGRTTRGN